jgi:hypothetical protein
MEKFENFQVEISKKDVLRLLGYKSGKTKMSQGVEKLINEAYSLSEGLLKPKAIVEWVAREKLKEIDIFNDAEGAIIAICTIGNELESNVNAFMSGSKLALGSILDAIGSEAVEGAVNYINKYLKSVAQERGYGISKRFSPGYGKWTLDAQRWIFSMIDAKSIGVTLTDTCMMIPRKSVSFAVKIYKKSGEEDAREFCEDCSMTECRFRKVHSALPVTYT